MSQLGAFRILSAPLELDSSLGDGRDILRAAAVHCCIRLADGLRYHYTRIVTTKENEFLFPGKKIAQNSE
jgi:hypothetical protein